MSFCCFEEFLGKFIENFSFLSESGYLRNRNEILRNLFFLPCFKWKNPEENLDLFKQLFLIKSLKWDNINKKCFSRQSEAHTPKLCLFVVFEAFLGKFIENFSF